MPTIAIKCLHLISSISAKNKNNRNGVINLDSLVYNETAESRGYNFWASI